MTYNFSTKYGTSDHTAAVSRGHEPGQKSYLQSGTLKSGFSTPTFSRWNPDSNVFTCSIETQSISNCSFYKKKILLWQQSLKNSTTIYFFRQKLLKNMYDISSDDKQLFFRQKQITLEFWSEIQSEFCRKSSRFRIVVYSESI